MEGNKLKNGAGESSDSKKIRLVKMHLDET